MFQSPLSHNSLGCSDFAASFDVRSKAVVLTFIILTLSTSRSFGKEGLRCNMAASDYSPLGSAALRSSVALDATSTDWARQSFAFTEPLQASADIQSANASTEAKLTAQAAIFSTMHVSGQPESTEIQPTPLMDPDETQRQKIRSAALLEQVLILH